MDQCSCPSLLPLPTAFVHLLLVELLPVIAFGLAAWNAGKKFTHHELLETLYLGPQYPADSCTPGLYRSSFHEDAVPCTAIPGTVPPRAHSVQELTRCLEREVSNFLIWENSSGVARCPGCDGRIDCKHTPFVTSAPVVLAWVVYGALLLTGLLVLDVTIRFICRGLLSQSFGSGAYLHFTWDMERGGVYRTLVHLMMIMTVITFSGITIAASGTDEFGSIISLIGFECLAMLWVLRKLLVMRVHHWPESTQFDAMLFRRTWWNLFLQSNDGFGARIMDALWCAKHGQLGPVRRLLAEEEEASNFVQLCSTLQEVSGHDDTDDEKSSISSEQAASRRRDAELTRRR